jgi:hypothetical protein
MRWWPRRGSGRRGVGRVEVGGVRWQHSVGGTDKQRRGKLGILTGGGVDGGSSRGRRCVLGNALDDSLHSESKRERAGSWHRRDHIGGGARLT